MAWITLGSAGTVLHVAAPWLVAYQCGAGIGVYALSGLSLLLSYAWMSVVPLWEMWRPWVRAKKGTWRKKASRASGSSS